ncbi:unnamed protein product [Urochloa decumbens]|uniref:Uncharacterized protein n=1 Tax=Urochloa decumbens TaxID=240449 RepID=A0ABC9FMD6_9POAL
MGQSCSGPTRVHGWLVASWATHTKRYATTQLGLHQIASAPSSLVLSPALRPLYSALPKLPPPSSLSGVRGTPALMEEQSLAAARGVGEGRRVSGGFGGGVYEEEMYERSADLAAARGGSSSSAAPAPSPATIAALFYPSPPPPQLVAGDSVVIGRNTAGYAAGHWNYNVSGEVAHLKRFELHLEKWEQDLKDREDALDRRVREVEDAERFELHLKKWEQGLKDREDELDRLVREAEDAAEREAAYLKRSQLLLQKREQILDHVEEALSRRERRVGEAQLRLEQQLQAQKVQKNTLGTEDPLLQQLEGAKNYDTCDWVMVGAMTVALLIFVLADLRRSGVLLSHGQITGVVLAVAAIWVPSIILLSNKLSGRYRSRRKFIYHVLVLICLCFSLANGMLYVLYPVSAY